MEEHTWYRPGPHLIKGYWRKAETTAEMLRDGWLYTGDIGHPDEDGYLFIASRKKYPDLLGFG